MKNPRGISLSMPTGWTALVVGLSLQEPYKPLHSNLSLS